MTSPTSAVKGPRIPLQTYRPANAPQVTACVVYLDPELGRVARSERSTLGIYRVSRSIHWDAGVLDRLQANEVGWLETYIRDIQATYWTTMQNMRQHGSFRNVCGGQIALGIKHWFVDIPVGNVAQKPVPVQMSLLEG